MQYTLIIPPNIKGELKRIKQEYPQFERVFQEDFESILNDPFSYGIQFNPSIVERLRRGSFRGKFYWIHIGPYKVFYNIYYRIVSILYLKKHYHSCCDW